MEAGETLQDGLETHTTGKARLPTTPPAPTTLP